MGINQASVKEVIHNQPNIRIGLHVLIAARFRSSKIASKATCSPLWHRKPQELGVFRENSQFAAAEGKMGGKCPHRRVKKRRYSHKTFRRDKFLVKDILFFTSIQFDFPPFCMQIIVILFVFFLDSVFHVMMLFTTSLKKQRARRWRCLQMKIFLGWVNTIVYTASM